MHHLINPRIGRPADGPWRTPSVAAATVVGGPAGLALIGESGASARLVARDGLVLHLGAWTPSWDELKGMIWPATVASWCRSWPR
jgi:hypothetical protein